MTKFGTIGTGSIVATFAQGCKLSGSGTITAVYSRSMATGAAFAKTNAPDAKVYDDMAAFLSAQDVDAVYIASPNSLHFQQALACLEHGKHVLCEKPATVTPQQLKQLMDLADEKGLIFMEAVMSLHQPQVAAVKQAIERCGRVREAHICYSQLSSKYPALMSGQLPNVFNPKFATGSLMDIGVYCVNAAALLLGIPKRVQAAASFLDTGADGSGCALWEYEDKLVTLSYSKVGQAAMGSQIIGDKGTVTIDLISMLTGVSFHYPDGRREDVYGKTTHPEAMGEEIKNFDRFVSAGAVNSQEYRSLCCHALSVCRLMEAMRRDAGIEFDLGE